MSMMAISSQVTVSAMTAVKDPRGQIASLAPIAVTVGHERVLNHRRLQSLLR